MLILSRSYLIDGVLGFQVQQKQMYALRPEECDVWCETFVKILTQHFVVNNFKMNEV